MVSPRHLDQRARAPQIAQQHGVLLAPAVTTARDRGRQSRHVRSEVRQNRPPDDALRWLRPSNIGVYGESTGSGVGVYGVSIGGDGVQAVSQNQSGVNGASANSYGVRGFSANSVGVLAASNSATGAGLLAQNDSGAPGGLAVIALGQAGVGVYASGEHAAVQLGRNPLSGAPSAGFHTAGELVLDANADLYLCKASGTPGTWKLLG